MTFKKNEIDSFVKIFSESELLIKACPGCIDVKLLEDNTNPSILFTLSYWESLNDLDNYRNSNLFITTWARTKELFDAKPEAWSLKEVFRE